MTTIPWGSLSRLALLTYAAFFSTGCGTAERICVEREEIPYEGGCGVCVCEYGAWSCSVNRRCSGSGGRSSTGSGGRSGASGGVSNASGGSEPNPGFCRAGETRRSGCNNCVCENGGWNCTMQACDPVCSPGTEVSVDCGPCACGDNGQWSCQNPGCAVQTCQSTSASGCGKGRYCNFPAGSVCGLSTLGVCRPLGDGNCDDNDAPVCGCDGRTHTNSCEAESRGVSIALTGECPTF